MRNSTWEADIPVETHALDDTMADSGRSGPRKGVVVALIAVAALVGVIATIALWASRQALDTDAWTETSAELLEDSTIQVALSARLVDAVFNSVDVKSELQASLPSDARALAVPATAGMHVLGERTAYAMLQRPLVQRLWQEANRAAHQTLLAALRGDSEVLATTGGVVTLNLVPMVEQLGERLGLDVEGRIPANVGRVELLRAERLASARLLAHDLRTWGILLPLLSLGCFVLAISLARGWRREALETVGIALLAIGVLVLIARGAAGAWFIDTVAARSAEPVTQSVWRVGTSLLAVSALSLAAYGVIIVLGTWLAGPTSRAKTVRNRIAPVLRQRRVAYGVLAVILVLVFWWDPTPATEWLVPSLILIVLAVVGIEALRAASVRDGDVARRERADDAATRERGQRAA